MKITLVQTLVAISAFVCGLLLGIHTSVPDSRFTLLKGLVVGRGALAASANMPTTCACVDTHNTTVVSKGVVHDAATRQSVPHGGVHHAATHHSHRPASVPSGPVPSRRAMCSIGPKPRPVPKNVPPQTPNVPPLKVKLNMDYNSLLVNTSATDQAPAPEAQCKQRPGTLFTFALVTRNDGYEGNPMERLATVLTTLGTALAERPQLACASEVLVVDWNSKHGVIEGPYFQTTPNMAHPMCSVFSRHNIPLRVLVVRPDVAKQWVPNAKGGLSEVHALNAAARRACGEMFFRLDQDTAVGPQAMDYLLDVTLKARASHSGRLADLPPPMNKPLWWSGRRETSPEHYKDLVSNPWGWVSDSARMSQLHCGSARNYRAAVGIMGMSTQLYRYVRGYSEQMVGRGHMEVQLWAEATTSLTTNWLKKAPAGERDSLKVDLKECENDFHTIHHTMAWSLASRTLAHKFTFNWEDYGVTDPSHPLVHIWHDRKNQNKIRGVNGWPHVGAYPRNEASWGLYDPTGSRQSKQGAPELWECGSCQQQCVRL